MPNSITEADVVVLNDVPRGAAYGYYAYYSYYLPGYEAVDESKHGRRTPAPTVV